MVDYLDNMSMYLKSHGIFRKSTVGVYVLVTKCDMIKCAPDDRSKEAYRSEEAYKYVCEELPSFWNTLQDTCKSAGVGDLKVLSFSVGDVFAQNLCWFDGADTDKVIDKLLTKTPAEKGGLWDFLKG